MKKGFLYIFFFVAYSFSFSQKQGNIWHFGVQAGLDFNSGMPVNVGGGQTNNPGQEGTACISDSSGSLLFYTSGSVIWNRFHLPMPNGGNLLGGISSTHAALIVPKPGNDSLFYVFTSDAFQGYSSPPQKGYRYSVVNICLDGGKGDIVQGQKNILLADSSTEKLAACRDAMGTGYWIIGHKMFSTRFIAWHLTSAGITSTVTSDIGMLHGWDYVSSSWSNAQGLGQMKLSSNGTKLALAIGNYVTARVDLLDFNPSSGVLSNLCHMVIDSILNKTIYGLEFSPDGSKLYTALIGGIGGTRVYQFDLLAGSCSGIQASRITIFVSTNGPSIFGMQLAPNNRIYLHFGSSNLSSIDFPNLPGISCAFTPSAITLAGLNYYTLPTFIAGYTYSNTMPPCCIVSSLSVNAPPILCSGSQATLSASGVMNYTWNPGNTNNSSIVVSPTANATYTVLGSNPGGCSVNTIISTVSVVPLPTLNVIGSSTVCMGSSVTLIATGAASYSWDMGTTTSSAVLSPTVNTNFTVYGTDVNGCKNSVVTNINVLPLPILSISGSKTVCLGASVIHTISGANSYTWNTGATSNTVLLTPSTSSLYSVSATNVNGCVNSATTSVSVIPLPILNITGGGTVCPGMSLTLFASGATSYTWNTGEITNTLQVKPTSYSIYTVTATSVEGCVNTSTVDVDVGTIDPVTTFSYNSPLCENGDFVSVQTSAGFVSGGTFSSGALNVDPSTGQLNLYSASAGTYIVGYSLPASDCFNAGTSTASVIIYSAPVLSISPNQSITAGGSVAIHVNGGGIYDWNPSVHLTCNSCSSPIATPSENTRFCVTSQVNGCSTTVCTDIFVLCQPNKDFSVPNAFSPNGDGNNDEFCLRGWEECTTNFQIMIFDRWGEKVYESNRPDFCWDGIYKNIPLANEVYVFVIKANLLNGERITKKGNISIIR